MRTKHLGLITLTVALCAVCGVVHGDQIKIRVLQTGDFYTVGVSDAPPNKLLTLVANLPEDKHMNIKNMNTRPC